jgi:hypothetical protein
MSSLEFSEWIEFYKHEPFGRDANFQGFALIAAMIYNVNRGKNDKALKVEDFMPKEPAPPQTTDQMLQFARMLTIGLGGTVKDE